MSTPFCLAVACADKEVTLKGIGQFTNPKILHLVEKIEHRPDEKIPRFSCMIDVEMKGGEKLNKEMIISPDYYNFNMERDIDLIKRVTTEAGVDPSKVDRIIQFIRGLENAENVKSLIDILARCP